MRLSCGTDPLEFMARLQIHTEIPPKLRMLVENSSSEPDIAELMTTGYDLPEMLAGLSYQLECKKEELMRVQERFDAASRARDRWEAATREGGLARREPGSTPSSRGRLRAEASLAQLQLNTIRNQVDYLAALIMQVQRTLEIVRARMICRE